MYAENNLIFIAWAARLDKSADLACRLDAPFYAVHHRFFGRNPRLLVPARYLLQSLNTWHILLQRRPAIIHVTNPPILAALQIYIYARLAGASYVLDTHTPALYSRKWGWTVPLLRVFARAALVNIVDQDRFKSLFESWGARALLLPKPPRSIVHTGSIQDFLEECSIAVVNTFAPDEPLEPILTAARSLPDIVFYVMGDTRLAPRRQVAGTPANIFFTGWLDHDSYWDRLARSRAVMVLTTYPYSLVAGGTDGMSLGKPLILSRQPALTEYFTRGAVFVENSGEGILHGVRRFQAHEERLQNEILELAVEKRETWESSFQELQNILAEAQMQASHFEA